MRAIFVWGALALGMAGALGVPVAGLHAATVQGTAITISGLDDLNATAHQEARKGSGKTLAMLVGLGGLATLFAGRIGLGLGGVGSALAMGFLPGMVNSAFDAAPAATLAMATPGVSALTGHWWTPALAVTYPAWLALRVLQDPVFLACLALGLTARYVLCPSGARASY